MSDKDYLRYVCNFRRNSIYIINAKNIADNVKLSGVKHNSKLVEKDAKISVSYDILSITDVLNAIYIE